MKIYLDMTGCRLNQAELELMAAKYASLGHELIKDAAAADIAVINTCTVTSAAAADSRQLLRRVIRQGAKEVFVTGCWATVDFEQAIKILPESHVFANSVKHSLVSESIPKTECVEQVEIPRATIPGKRRKTRAFIKVQDGCDHFCTYCITRIARGHSISLPQKDILRSIEGAIETGCHEIVLCGVNLGSWGKDTHEEVRLSDLIKDILSCTPIERIRLSSMEPWDVTEEFLDLFQDKRVCRHLHLPLQSGSDTILQRMNRLINTKQYRALIDSIFNLYPDMAITTDLIAGFPGEDTVQFNKGLNFITSMPYAGGHVFPFSPRKNTPAACMPGQVNSIQKKERARVLRSIMKEKQKIFRMGFIGQIRSVLWENIKTSPDDGFTYIEGLTDNYIRVQTSGDASMLNTVSSFLISESSLLCD